MEPIRESYKPGPIERETVQASFQTLPVFALQWHDLGSVGPFFACGVGSGFRV